MATLDTRLVALCIAKNNWGPGGSRDKVISFLDTAIAVCRAESGFVTTAVSDTGDYGLWQINKAAHPQYFTPVNMTKIFDPIYNTQCAKKIYDDAGGWTPWSAYKSGAYKQYLGEGKAAYVFLEKYSRDEALRKRVAESARKLAGSDDTGLEWYEYFNPAKTVPYVFGGVKSGTENLLEEVGAGALVGKVLSFARDAGKTAGLFILGVIILLIGLYLMTRNTKLVRGVTGIVSPMKKAKMISKVVS